MKYALIIPDGVADEPQTELGGQTPLEAADLPQMDAIAKAGIVGQTDNIPASMPSGSDVGTMSLFGYDPLEFHTGRAPLEAAAQGIRLGPHDWAIRCNLVTVQNEKMVSFTAGQIPSAVGSQLVELLQRDQCGSDTWKFHTGVSYRNLLLYRSRDGSAPFDRSTATTPPHDIIDQPILDHLPQGPGSNELRELMDRSVPLFAGCTGNSQRADAGELPATQIWLWGEGKAPAMPLFAERFGVQGAVITAVDLLRGIGRLLGWDVIEVPGATGYTDTDYAAKGQYAIAALGEKDFVVVHVEATDEASHEGEVHEKVKAVEAIDRHIVGPVHDALKASGDYRILICPDHPTFLRTKTHSHGYCPFAMCGTGIVADSNDAYHERQAAASGLVLEAGHQLMPLLFQSTRPGG